MKDDQLHELLGEMRDDLVPAESMARVRMAVTARMQARRRLFGMGWKVGGALALAGCLAGVMLRPRAVAPAQVPPAAPVVAAQQSAPVAAPEPMQRPVVHTRAKAAAKPVSDVQQAPDAPGDAGAHEIRIENPYDPDVVIVLIGD